MGGAADDRVRAARAYLLGVAEPPAPALTRLVTEQGAVAAAERVQRGDVPGEVAELTRARAHRTVSPAELDRAREAGMRLIVPEDEEWPAWPLLSLEVAAGRGVAGMLSPLGLWACGQASLERTVRQAVTIVGARAATGYGEHTAADWAYTLAARGVTIVSGAAYGVDAAAHRGALASTGATVAVLGCGVDAGYPAGHDAMLRRIAERGLVLSEYPPGTRPARHRFLVRNRLLAALTAGTVVVEADLRSGARNTASTATSLGKSVMAVPGPVTSRMSRGCHELVRSAGATLVASAAEVAEEVGTFGVDLEQRPAEQGRELDGLSRTAGRVYDALDARSGRSAEQLATEAGLPVGTTRAVLCELELDGLSLRCEDGWLRGRSVR
ncbi:DNA processing protein [Haloechinothrix alba]|uniref:DNA processing protein n=1 Tax=Haloechinothrix alba TaxID=664784 RepID=A0A238YQC7_9PSEU|nr:DNA-processing protein DprA [Haloechinothrix alba]SNR72639.1 DNA processing protein [Haloechinothrix alba]